MKKETGKILNEEEVLYRWRMAGGWEVGQLIELDYAKLDRRVPYRGQHALLGCWVDAETLKPDWGGAANIEFVAHQLTLIDDIDERQVAMIRVIEHTFWNTYETYPEGMLAGAHNFHIRVIQERVDFGQGKYTCPAVWGWHRCDICRDYRGKWLTSEVEFVDRLAHMSKNMEKWCLAKIVGYQLDDHNQEWIRRDKAEVARMKITRTFPQEEMLS